MARRNGLSCSELRAVRKTLGLSQEQLGELLSVSRNTIRSWETGAGPSFCLLMCRGLRAFKVFPHLFVDMTGPCLADARSRLGFHQDELAEKLCISRPTLSRWENGTPPGWVKFALIALVFLD
ncbi:TPA: transcriptional regulator [Pseudomonas aeruginosa]|nr:transcriptional regulator [Pseudomonas aeruginosa]